LRFSAQRVNLCDMSTSPLSFAIPTDLGACQALVEQLAMTVAGLEQEKQAWKQEKQELELAYAELLQRAFRNRSERYLNNPDQLRLDLGNTDEAADAAAGLAEAIEEAHPQDEQVIPEHTRRRPRRRRQEKLPEHLERVVVEVEAAPEVIECPTHGPRKLIGYDEVETLKFTRPKLWVQVTRYPKFACEGEGACGVTSPERPEGLVEGNRYDSSVAAEIITGKYGYHLPIYREQDYFAGSGWTPARSTLLNIQKSAAGLLPPLMEYYREVVLGGKLIGVDETGLTLLLPQTIPRPIEGDLKSQRIYEVFSEAKKNGKPSVSARMWAYRGMVVPLNLFDFTVSRHRDGPDLFLRDFRGKLMADCWSGFQKIGVRTDGAIERGACVAHARRKVLAGLEGYPLEASILLAQFQQLYDIETRAKTMSLEERHALRQAEAPPVWSAMRDWLDSEAAARITPKSKLGEALGYLRNHWNPLQLYLTDPRMPIDNNEVEQLMKQIALGRKNWLFVGSVAAGERAAHLMTLVSSAVRNDLEVWLFVKDVLDQLLAGSTDYYSLLPHIWKQSHPEAIRTYRAEERRDRADRQQRRRASRRR
jgi:transposase